MEVMATSTELINSGFHRMGATANLSPTEMACLAELSKQDKTFSVETASEDPNQYFLSDMANPTPNHCLINHSCTLTDDARDFGTALEEYERGPYCKKSSKVGFPGSVLSESAATVLKNDVPKNPLHLMHLIRKVAFNDNPEKLRQSLKDTVLPRFFDRYPSGRVMILNHNYVFEKRLAFCRAAYSLSQYPLAEFSRAQSFSTLRKWESLDSVVFPRVALSLLDLAFFPTVPYVVGGPHGLTFLFILDPPEIYQPVDFPSDWMSFPQSVWDLQSGQSRSKLVPLNSKSEDIEELAKWWTKKISNFAHYITSPCNFIENGAINFVTCFEYGITADRILRRGISALAETSNSIQKDAVFEIADLLESLRSYKDTTSKNTIFFKRLFNASQGKQLMEDSFIDIPEPFKTGLRNITETVYDDLVATVRESVFVDRTTASGDIRVRNAGNNADNLEAPEDFVANVCRTIRNAHHGYLTFHDQKKNRPSRYLSLVDGNTSQIMSNLGTLWAIALAANPKEMVNLP